VETARIKHPLDPFTHGKSAAGALPRDPLGPAHLMRQLNPSS
jgi:hypothetical protein